MEHRIARSSVQLDGEKYQQLVSGDPETTDIQAEIDFFEKDPLEFASEFD